MSYTQIVKKQTLNENIDKVWEFMSSPKNLEEITPNEMSFNITSSNKDEKMYEGMIITYKVTPLLNIPLSWMTEITHVKDKKFFVEGEKQLGFLFNDFPNQDINKAHIINIINNAMNYSLNFDLQTPNFNDVKVVSVNQVLNLNNNHKIRTAKRLGFKLSNETNNQ